MRTKKERLTIEPRFIARGSGNNPYAGKKDLHYVIKEWGYVFPDKKRALEYAKTHIATNQDGINGVIIESKKLRKII